MTQTPDWRDLTRFATALADAAAAAILPHFRQNTPVDVKNSIVWDPVTEGDRAGERAIRQLIEERFPEHNIHGEEYGVKDAGSPFTWVLDPVDGTRSFVFGMPTWATLIGLTYEGRPVVGVMNQPFVGDMFYGNPDGAWHNHRGAVQRIRTRRNVPLAKAAMGTTAPELYRSASDAAGFERLRHATQITRYGGDAYFFALMAAGHIDIAMDAGLQAYDIAALLPIIAGAGGAYAEWTGGNPVNGGNIISAGSRALLDEALAVLCG